MHRLFFLITMLIFSFGTAQLNNIKSGEQLNYRIHYGILNAGTASLSTKKINFQGIPHLYVRGVGRSTGAVRAFFKVEDLYESYINTQTGLPTYYVRNVKEGGYSQHLHTAFNHNNQSLILMDKKNPNTSNRTINTVKGIQDMLSAFYYLRSLNDTELKIGKIIKLNVWIDDEMFPFLLRIDGVEDLKTKFGTINCLKITPMVMSGRIFKAKESVKMWVTNDQNKVPVSIKAELVVGALKADLDSYSDVMHTLNFRK